MAFRSFALIALFALLAAVAFRASERGIGAAEPAQNAPLSEPKAAEKPAAPTPRSGRRPAPPPPDPLLDGKDGHNLALNQFQPISMLHVPEHRLTHAKFPVVDIHTHMRYKTHHSPEALHDMVKAMDEQNVAVCNSLDGQLDDALEDHKKYLWTDYKDRFCIFANVAWQGTGQTKDPASWDCQRPDFGRRMALKLAEAKEKGACGLKIFKNFGLEYRNPDGSLIKIDDPRWDPIWEACGKLNMPILIHTADPPEFFTPIDNHNQRWETLRQYANWSFYGPGWPSHTELLDAFLRVVERHPKTTFITAHMGNIPEDLARLGTWLDKYPNLYTETAARLGELSRQPVTAHKFFIKYADRIMFGTDGPLDAQRLLPFWRVFETDDEYFNHLRDGPDPVQGRLGELGAYGMNLPDDVLRKLYYENACRIIPGVKERVEKYVKSRR